MNKGKGPQQNTNNNHNNNNRKIYQKQNEKRNHKIRNLKIVSKRKEGLKLEGIQLNKLPNTRKYISKKIIYISSNLTNKKKPMIIIKICYFNTTKIYTEICIDKKKSLHLLAIFM